MATNKEVIEAFINKDINDLSSKNLHYLLGALYSYDEELASYNNVVNNLILINNSTANYSKTSAKHANTLKILLTKHKIEYLSYTPSEYAIKPTIDYALKQFACNIAYRAKTVRKHKQEVLYDYKKFVRIADQFDILQKEKNELFKLLFERKIL